MMTFYYAFLIGDRVQNITNIQAQDDALAAFACETNGYDQAIFVEGQEPVRWSTWDGQTFTPPTDEYLISIGVLNPAPPPEPEEVVDPVA
jgi:hypothetical protein